MLTELSSASPMATTFLLWPAAPSSSPERSCNGDGGDSACKLQLMDQESNRAPGTISKPKARKAGGKQPAPKRPPQRGLGVAQLERLRLQDRWNKIADAEITASIYAPAPVTYVGGGGWNDLPMGSPAYCFLQRCRALNPVIAPNGSVSTVRSVLHDQYALDRVRMSGGEARFCAASPPTVEPPSNQKPQCLPGYCEFCARKKRLYGDDLGFNGADIHGTNHGASIAIQELREPEKKMEYYEFFPHGDDVLRGHSEFADRTAADASLSSGSSEFLDLSLKLSC